MNINYPAAKALPCMNRFNKKTIMNFDNKIVLLIIKL